MKVSKQQSFNLLLSIKKENNTIMAEVFQPFVSRYQGHLFAGVDEVGRGPLDGDVLGPCVCEP